MRRYAQRVDDNQAEIIKTLRMIPGLSVEIIGKPVDLLIGWRSTNWLFEVKREDKRGQQSRITPAQHKFIPTWNGQVCIVHNVDEILHVLNYVNPTKSHES